MKSPRRLWPTEAQTLLLHAALASGPAAADAWNRFHGIARGELDAGAKRLLPLVWLNLTRQGVDDARRGALEKHYEECRRDNAALIHQIGGLLQTFNARSIPTIILKGGALISQTYDDPGGRPAHDVDMLVPLSRVADAARVLSESGFSSESPMTPAALELTHGVPWRRDGHAPVDLHWHVFEEGCRPSDDDDLWTSSREVHIGGGATRVLADEDLLLHVCAHGEKWVFVPGIRWIADAVMVLRHGQIDWDRFVRHAVTRGVVLRMRDQLAYLAREFAAPVPETVLSALAAAPTSRLERFEHRLSVRDRRRPWVLVYWCNHLRATGGVVRAAVTFPRYLQAIWRLESLADVPSAAIARVTRRVRAVRPTP